MKIITRITVDSYDDTEQVHVVKSPHTLEILNKYVIELMWYELNGNLVWNESKREFYEWLECAQINTDFFFLKGDVVEIDYILIPMFEFLKFKSLWNDTYGCFFRWDFSIET